MSPLKKSHNIAARMGRWSARHRKIAIFGWLAFVIAAVAIGGAVGTKNIDPNDTIPGESGRATRVLEDGFKQPARETVIIQSRKLTIDDPAFRQAIDDVVSSIVSSVVRCLSKAPPELAQDFLVRGMFLVGGGGLLRGLAQRIERETQVPVKMSNVPLEAVVLGAGHCIEHYDALKNMFMGARR